MNDQRHDPATEFAACRQELAEARAQHDAVAEVLRIIGRTAIDVQVALEAIAERVLRLCRADVARVCLRDGDAMVTGSMVSDYEGKHSYLRRLGQVECTAETHEHALPVIRRQVPMTCTSAGRTVLR